MCLQTFYEHRNYPNAKKQPNQSVDLLIIHLPTYLGWVLAKTSQNDTHQDAWVMIRSYNSYCDIPRSSLKMFKQIQVTV